MLVHSFNRFYVVTKFMLPMIGDLKFSKLDFDYTCAYTEKEYAPNTDSRKYMLEFRSYCNKIKPFVTYYNKLINSYNNTAHKILEKEIKFLLPQVSKRQKCEIISTLVSGFIGLAYEDISSFLQHKQNNALHKAVNAMNNKANMQCNKLMKFDDKMLMYGIYNVETLEKLIKTLHKIHNTTYLHEKLFAGEHNHSIFRILHTHSLGLQHYSTKVRKDNAAERRKRAAPTKRCRPSAAPKTGETATQPPLTVFKATEAPENRPPTLEKAKVCESTPWPGAGRMSGNLFEDRHW